MVSRETFGENRGQQMDDVLFRTNYANCFFFFYVCFFICVKLEPKDFDSSAGFGESRVSTHKCLRIVYFVSGTTIQNIGFQSLFDFQSIFTFIYFLCILKGSPLVGYRGAPSPMNYEKEMISNDYYIPFWMQRERE